MQEYEDGQLTDGQRIAIMWREIHGDNSGGGIVARQTSTDKRITNIEGIIRWFVVTVRVIAFFGPFAGAAVAVFALVTR